MAQDRSNPGHIVFPLGLSRMVRRIERDLYDPNRGLIQEFVHFRKRLDALFWLALGTFGTVVLGTLAIVMRAYGF